MYPHYEKVAELLRGNKYRAVVASRDEFGVPHLSPEIIWHWDKEAIWFSKFPRTRTLKNIARFPETAVSIVDWAKFQGLQIKGIATRVAQLPAGIEAPGELKRMQGAGITELVRLEVMEVYDVIPKEGADLSIPLWWKRRHWSTAREMIAFQTPALQPVSIPDSLRNTLSPIVDRLRKKFVPAFIGTLGDESVPNISPRFILEVGANYWFYGDGFRNKTFMNTARPSPLSIAVVDWDAERGYLAHGWTEFKFTGEWLEKIKSHWSEMSFKGKAIQAVLFHPENIEEIGITAPRTLFTGRTHATWTAAVQAR